MEQARDSRQNALGTEQLLGSGQSSDTHDHDALVVPPSGRLLLKFWNSFNNIGIISPSLDPSIRIAPEDGDWLLLK